jgi:hypothetical protein
MFDTRGLVIGELAVRESLLTREQLEDLVDQQQKMGFSQPLGALMLERKLLSRQQLDDLLKRQKQAISDYERSLSVSGLFGRIAIERGFIGEKELAEAVRRQLALDYDGQHLKIGQILIRMKALTPIQFWEIIHAQGLFRCGSCGHTLDVPRLEGMTLFCEKCDKPALSLNEN